MSARVQKLAVKVADRSRPLLEPGETVLSVRLAQGGMPPVAAGFLLGGLLAISMLVFKVGGALGGLLCGLLVASLVTRRVIVRTDQALLLLEYGKLTFSITPRRVLARLPQDTTVAPSGGFWAVTHVAGEKLYVHKKWQHEFPIHQPTT
ncbi:hypothetical protein AB0M28_39490 [Streptomyces sp. NPDC051940]|uniref:hypothetical protein n=1 Tax=Streptomyces sp. NPDC051940 TaxID=3155675 RepID=UPI0034305996